MWRGTVRTKLPLKLSFLEKYFYAYLNLHFNFIFKDYKTNTDTVYENVTEVLKSGLDGLSKYIQNLKERNAVLEAELQEKNDLIENLSQVSYYDS